MTTDPVTRPRRAAGVADGGERAQPRPSLVGEGRAGLELLELLFDPVYYGLDGDRAPVLLVPAFLATDETLLLLHGWLGRAGYRPYASGLGPMLGSPSTLLGRLLRRAEAIVAAEDRRLTVIGHSLGGGLARALAGRRPDLVARVITLGFPQGGDLRGAGHPMMEALAERLLRDPGSGLAWAAERARMEELFSLPVPADVQLTSIYSRDDAVVDWRTCVISGPGCAAYEVRGSHMGLAWNAQVYRLIGRVLAG